MSTWPTRDERGPKDHFGQREAQARHALRLAGQMSPAAPLPPSPEIKAALDISQPLDTHTVDRRASELLAYLNAHNLISKPREVSPCDGTSRLGFQKPLSRFADAIGLPGMNIGKLPGQRLADGTSSHFAEVRLCMGELPYYPTAIFMALEGHLHAIGLTAVPVHFTILRDSEPVSAPFQEPWANELFAELNSI